MSQNARRVVIVQHAGDYAEAYLRLVAGGDENYYAQRYSVDIVGALADEATAVTTICCTSDTESDVMLSNGVRSIGLRSSDGLVDERRVWEAVLRCEPTHLVLRSPQSQVLRNALACASIESIPLMLADSFDMAGLRSWWKSRRLRELLNHPRVALVGNHGINASESLRRIGVDATKVIPWDWPHENTPRQLEPKQARQDPHWTLLFIGMLSEAKGLGDVMRAVATLDAEGIPMRLTYAGKGDNAFFEALAQQLGISDRVDYLGLVAHSRVIPLMRGADLVVVPSRHEYPEGFPMTIYEALASRTPIIASDHPMFARHLTESGAAIVYPAGDHVALAASIKRSMAEPALYQALSEASLGAWDQLQLRVTWGQLVTEWLAGGAPALAEISRNSLSALRPSPH